DYLDEVLLRTPLGRIGEPEEVAAAVAFLCLPAASYITAECIPGDGGVLRYGFSPRARRLTRRRCSRVRTAPPAPPRPARPCGFRSGQSADRPRLRAGAGASPRTTRLRQPARTGR